MKTLLIGGGVLGVVAIATAALFFYGKPVPVTDYKNATYTVAGSPVTLVNGRSESAATDGSAAKVVTQFFGNEAIGDVNGDGRPDVAFLLTQTTGGSGTFYYAVVALQTTTGYVGTNAVLLGDRIAPQTTEIHDGTVLVNFADRAAGEPMTAQPSEGKSLYLQVHDGVLEPDNTTALTDTVRLMSPLAGSTTTSPIHLVGEARGSWYFEASFPVVLVDFDGKIIAQGIATAQTDWMTTDFVPFTADLTYAVADIPSYSHHGTLILQKDNPSGLPANDNALEVPVLLQ